MTTIELAKLIQANISDAELTNIKEYSLLQTEEAVIATLFDKGIITSEVHDEIADSSELMLAVQTALVEGNKVTITKDSLR